MQNRGAESLKWSYSPSVCFWVWASGAIRTGRRTERGAMPEGVWGIEYLKFAGVHFSAKFTHCIWKCGWFVGGSSGVGSWVSGTSKDHSGYHITHFRHPVTTGMGIRERKEREIEGFGRRWGSEEEDRPRGKEEIDTKTLLSLECTNAFVKRQLQRITLWQKIKWRTEKETSFNALFITQLTR